MATSVRIREHLQSNVVGYLALFAILTLAPAYAAGLKANSVKSKHIRNGQVRAPDLGRNAVGSPTVIDDSLTGADIDESTLSIETGGPAVGPAGGALAGSYPDPTIAPAAVGAAELAGDVVSSPKVLNGSISGVDVENDSLTGADVDESTLAAVPAAAAASDADTVDGRHANSLIRVAAASSSNLADGSGDKLNAVITAPSGGYLILNASVGLNTFPGGAADNVFCSIKLDGVEIAHTFRAITVPTGGFGTCATNGRVQVASAGAYSLKLSVGDVSPAFVDAGAIEVLFQPFNGSGA